MMRFLSLCCGLLVLPLFTAAEEKKSPFERWEKAIAAIETRLKNKAPPKDAIFFAGSSSIVNWDLAKAFPDLPVVKVGFGGSQVADSVHFAPRIVVPFKPATIVFYAGDNDIASGKSPETVRDDFAAFVRVVRKDLPDTRIIFLSIKPSIARWKKIEQIRAANKLIEADCKKEKGLVYVDVGTGLLGDDGMLKKEMFVKDGLHLSAEGYQLWNKVLLPYLKPRPALKGHAYSAISPLK